MTSPRPGGPGRPHKFPNSTERSPEEPIAFCPVNRVIALYNEAKGQDRRRMSDSVEEWFDGEASVQRCQCQSVAIAAFIGGFGVAVTSRLALRTQRARNARWPPRPPGRVQQLKWR